MRALQRASKYFVEDPEKACVLVPNFEHTLASNEMGTPLVIAQTLRSLPTWERYGGPGIYLFPACAVVCRVCVVCVVSVCAVMRVSCPLTREKRTHPGFNHLLFNKHDDVGVEYDPAYAMVAKVGWSTGHYRPAFDISLNILRQS